MNGHRLERHPRPSRSERQQRCVSTQVNLIANQLPEVNQDFLNLAQSQLEAFNELQQSHQSVQPSRNHRSRSPPSSCPHPPSQRYRSRSPPPSRPTPPSRPQSPPPYTHYRQRPRQPSPAARPRTPPTPYHPISPQEPFQSDTLPDAPNRSPSPSVLGWDTYITDCQSAHGSNTSHTCFAHRGNLANRGIWNGQEKQGLHHINSPQDASHRGNNRGEASRGRRQRPHPLHEWIHF